MIQRNITPRSPRLWGGMLLAVAVTIASLGSGVAAASSGGATAPGDPTAPSPSPSPTPTPPSSGYVFPIQGAHTYGQPFGVGRGKHVHQGQDVMAACSTPLVAVTHSRVRFRGFQRAAGNYVVLRDLASRQDYMYAHMMLPSLVRKGQVLLPGQQVGIVGRTGDATACHLHFEQWVVPGWYRGGHPINPLPFLQYLDGLP